MVGAGLSLGHLIRLTLLPYIFLSGLHQGCCVRAAVGYHFAVTWRVGKGCGAHNYPRLA
jgi:hypothetical protein